VPAPTPATHHKQRYAPAPAIRGHALPAGMPAQPLDDGREDNGGLLEASEQGGDGDLRSH
jgi:hypothetical protein